MREIQLFFTSYYTDQTLSGCTSHRRIRYWSYAFGCRF